MGPRIRTPSTKPSAIEQPSFFHMQNGGSRTIGKAIYAGIFNKPRTSY